MAALSNVKLAKQRITTQLVLYCSTSHRIVKMVEKKIVACVPVVLPFFLDLNNNKVTGLFATYVNSYLEVVKKEFNATTMIHVSKTGLGDRIGDSDSYDGCLGELQRGEADIIGQAMNYPLDIVNVSQGFILFDERVAFSGVFPRPDSVKAADLARSIYVFEWPIYLVIFFYLVLFAVVFKIRCYMRMKIQKSIILARGDTSMQKKLVQALHRRIERRSKRSPGFSDIVRHFAQTNFIEEDSYFVAVITTVLTLFSFFILAYFNNLLNTDLVIPNKAKMYENYDELMENNVKPMFLVGMSYHEDLKYAKEGSKGKLFWDWAVRKFGEKNLFSLPELQYFGDHLFDIANSQKVLFASHIMGMLFRSSVCDVLDRKFANLDTLAKQFDPRPIDWYQFEDTQVYTRNDDSAPNVIKSIVFSRKIIENEKFYTTFKKLFHRSFETGHFEANIRMLKRAKLTSAFEQFDQVMGRAVPERLVIKYRCKENNVPVPKEPNIDRLILLNFQFSFYACLFLLSCALLVLAYEKVLHK